MKELLKMMLAVGALAAGGSQMFATSVAPGGTVPVPFTAVLPVGSPLATLTSVGSWYGSNGRLDGSVKVVSAAYYDSSTKGIDFFYEIENTYQGATRANDTLSSSIGLLSFAGAKANVFQLRASGSGPFFGPFIKPNPDAVQLTARSTGTGKTLTLSLTTALVPRFNTAVFEVRTNGKGFGDGLALLSWKAAPTAGSIGTADSQFFDLEILEPILTPEPGFYGLLAAGFAGLLLILKRRKANDTLAA